MSDNIAVRFHKNFLDIGIPVTLFVAQKRIIFEYKEAIAFSLKLYCFLENGFFGKEILSTFSFMSAKV